MTRLASISNNHLALTCDLCGHTNLVAVQTLIEHLGKETTVHHAVTNCRCSNCQVKGKASFRIVFVGGAGDAMLGAQQGPDG